MTQVAAPHANELILLPALKAHPGQNGGLVLTRKYMNGAAEYAARWPGPVTSLVDLHDTPTTDLDHVEVFPGAEVTGIELRPTDEKALAERLRGAAAVLAFLSRYELPTARLCRQIGVPIIYTAEYSVRTERQIMRTQTRNPILRARRNLWITRSERLRKEALGLAQGLQCSGTPTYAAYHELISPCLLFFDNRVPRAQVLPEIELVQKSAVLEAKRPLRLVFGGRLIEMKGVQHLPHFARALRARGVPFTLDIYGGGPLEEALATQIAAMDLSTQVRLRGVLDFESEWIPRLKSEVDLFICCHPQGDPSSTYPEVMSCAVPIAGFDNEALAGIVEHSGAGWATPLGDVEALADTVAALHDNRGAMVEASAKARAFALEHCFEATMDKRSAHLRQCSGID